MSGDLCRPTFSERDRRRLSQDLYSSLAAADASGYGLLIDDQLAETDGNSEVLAERPGLSFGRDLAREQGVLLPGEGIPGDFHGYLRATDPRSQARQALASQGLRAPGHNSAAFEAMEGWATGIEDQLLAKGDAFSQQDARASLVGRYQPIRAAGELVGGLAYDNHLTRYTELLASAETVSIGLFSAEHPVLAAGMTNAFERIGGGNFSMRTNAPMSYTGRGYNAYYTESFGSSMSTPAPLRLGAALASYRNTAASYLAGELKITDHFKYVAADLHDPQKSIIALGSVNATSASLGGLGRNRGAYGRGSNIESMVYLRAQDFGDSKVFTSLAGQMQRAHAWALSDNLDLGQEQALLAAARGIKSGVSSRAVSAGIQAELSQISTGALESMFAGAETSGVSRVLSGHGLQRKHIELLRAMGAGDSAMITSYDYGDAFLDEVKAAVDRGAKVSVLTGARYDFSDGISLRADQDIVDRLHGAAQGRSGLDVVVNESEPVHAKVSMFQVGGQGHAVYGSMNFDDDQWYNLYYNRSKAKYAGAIRNLGVYLSASEYARYSADERVTKNLIEMSRLTTRMVAGTGYFDADVGAVRQLFAGYGFVGGDRLQISASEQGTEFIRATVGGRFNVGATTYDLGSIMSLTMTKPTAEANAKGFGFKGQYFVPELSKFVGPGWTAAQSGNGAPTDLLALEVLAAGLAATQNSVGSILNQLSKELGATEFDRRMNDPIYRGVLRSQVKQFNRHALRNLPGFEAGTPAFGAKGLSRLIFKSTTAGVDLASVAKLDAVTIDGMLTGGSGWTVGNREFFFTASGASRPNARGESKPARFYDMAALDALPVAGRGDNSELMFLFPLSKIAQLPQRLQSILAARHLTPEADMDIIRAIGGKSAESIMATSQFEAADGSRLKGIRFQGFAVPGLSGDQNAYLIGERFEDMYFGNESFRKTVKLSMQSVTPGDQGRLMIEQLQDLVSTQKAVALGDDRYVITHENLKELQHRLNVATHRIHDTGLVMTEALGLGTEHIRDQHIVLDMKKGRGTSLVKNDGYWSFTISGRTLEPITSGSRSMLGAKTPHVMVWGHSKPIEAIHGAMKTVYGAEGIYTRLGMSDFNVVFGSGAIKSGQAFVETGIELLKTDVWRSQLNAMSGTDLKSYEHVITRLAGFIDTSSAVHGQMMALANQAAAGKLGEAELNRLLSDAAKHLNAGGGASLSKSGANHAAAAIVAFGIHAQYSTNQLIKHQGAATQLQGAFGAPPIREGGALTFDSLGDQQLLGGIWMTWVSGLSALATPVSTRNRVNFMNYHAGGYTDAFFNLMAHSPEIRDRAKAYNEILVGGLLGRGGQDDVVFANDFNPMSRYFQGAGVDGFDPFIEAQADAQRARAVFAGEYESGDMVGNLRQLRARRQRVASGMAAVNAHLDGHRAAGTSVYTATGGFASAGDHHHLGAVERAGAGSRTILVPEIGYLDGRGQFQFNPGAHGERAQVRYREMVFLSAAGLRSLGSLEDYSSRINQLQVRAEQLMQHLGSLEAAMAGRGLDYHEQDQYRELMETMGMLADAQRGAAATGLQQLLGGQLAAVGKNVIAGTLPGVMPRELVVGRQVWEFLRTESAASVLAGLQGSDTVAGAKILFNKLRGQLGDTSVVDMTEVLLDRALEQRNIVTNQIDDIKHQVGELHDRTRAAYAGAKNERKVILRGKLGSINRSLNAATDAFVEWRSGENNRIGALYDHMRATLVDPLMAEIDAHRGLVDAAQSQRAATAAQLGNVRQRLVPLRQAVALRDKLGARSMATNRHSGATLGLMSGLVQQIAELEGRASGLEKRMGWYEQQRAEAFALDLAGDSGFFESEAVWRQQLNAAEQQHFETLSDLDAARDQLAGLKRSASVRQVDAVTRVARAQQVVQTKLDRMGRLAGREKAMLEQLVVDDWHQVNREQAHFQEVRGLNIARASVASRGIGRRMKAERAALAGLEQTYWNEITEDDRNARVAAMQETEAYYNLRTAEIDVGHAHEMASLRAQKKLLVERLKGQANVNQVVQEHLALLLDDPLIRKAMGMVAIGQRAGAPMGPEALIVFDKIVNDSEFNKRDKLQLHERLNERGAFLNIGAMGFFLGDFDGDQFGIAPLKEYLRLRTLQAVGGDIGEAGKLVLADVEGKLKYTEEERLFVFGRQYTGLASIFDDHSLYVGSDKILAGMSTENARTAIHGIRDRAHAGALAMGLSDVDAAYEVHQGLGTSNQFLTDVFAGQDTVHGLNRDQMASIFAGFQERRAIAKTLGISTNQYVAEMMETHTAVYQYMQENVGSGTRTELFERFFTSHGVDEFAKKLEKSTRSITEQTTKNGDAKPLTWNEMITFFVATSYASSNVIAKVFEATYTMLVEADRIRTLQKIDAAGMTSAAVLADDHHSRIQGLGIVLQQIARSSIKPKGAEDPLEAVRTRMTGGDTQGPLSRLFSGSGINRAQVVSGVDLVLRQFEGVDWWHRMVTGRTLDDKAFDLAGMDDAAWETAHEAITKQLAGYHQETFEKAFASGVLNPEVLDKLYRGQVPKGIDPKLFETELPADETARKALIAERKEAIVNLTHEMARDQANLLINTALASSGASSNQSEYRQGLESENSTEFHKATAGMFVEERMHEFFKLTARGKFTDPEAMKRGMLDIFREFGDGSPELAGAELQQLAHESSGSEEFGRNMRAVFESYAAGSDFDGAYLKGMRHSRANFTRRAKAENYADTLRNELVEKGQLEAGDSEKVKTASLFELYNMVESRSTALERENLGSDNKEFLKVLYETGVASDYDRARQDRLLSVGNRDYSMPGGPAHPTGVGASAIEAVAKGAHSNPLFTGTVMGVIGTLGVMAMVPQAAHAAQSETPDGWHTAGEITGAALAFLSPRAAFNSMLLADQDSKEKLAMAGTFGIALAAGSAVTSPVHRAVTSWALGSHDPDLVHGRQAARATGRAGLVGMAAATVASVLAGGAAGVLASFMFQQMGLMRPINPVPEMINQLMGFDFEGLEGSVEADIDAMLEEEIDGEHSVEGVVQIRDAAGELIAQDFYRFNWAATGAGDDDDFDTQGFMAQGLDTFVSSTDYEEAGLG